MVTDRQPRMGVYAQASVTPPFFLFYPDLNNSVRIVLELGDARFYFLLAKMEAQQEGGKNPEEKQQELEQFFHGTFLL